MVAFSEGRSMRVVKWVLSLFKKFLVWVIVRGALVAIISATMVCMSSSSSWLKDLLSGESLTCVSTVSWSWTFRVRVECPCVATAPRLLIIILLSCLRRVGHEPVGTLCVLTGNTVQLRRMRLPQVSCCSALSDSTMPPRDNSLSYCSGGEGSPLFCWEAGVFVVRSKIGSYLFDKYLKIAADIACHHQRRRSCLAGHMAGNVHNVLSIDLFDSLEVPPTGRLQWTWSLSIFEASPGNKKVSNVNEVFLSNGCLAHLKRMVIARRAGVVSLIRLVIHGKWSSIWGTTLQEVN